MAQLKIYLPPPANWQDLQDLVVQIAKMQYVPDSVQDFGRQGQSQFGLDAFAEDGDGRKIGFQCKETKGKLKLQTVEEEADKATTYSQKLDLLIIATTARRDGPLQVAVNLLNDSRKYRFRIRVDFWDTLQHYINQSAMVLNSCYEQYRTAFQVSDESHHLECLCAAFDRPAFRDDFRNERNYADFGEALAETMRLFSIGIVRDRCSSIGVIQTVPIRSLPDGKYKTAVKKIDDMLAKMYRDYISDARRLSADSLYAENRAGHYNIARGNLLKHLNTMLVSANLPTIAFQYS
jgi:hypothetical protein